MIERLARGEIKRAARDELTVSDARINAMLAHIRGEAADPTTRDGRGGQAGPTQQHRPLPQTSSTASSPSSATSKPTSAFADSPAADSQRVQSEWRLICAAHNMLKPADPPRPGEAQPRPQASLHQIQRTLLSAMKQ